MGLGGTMPVLQRILGENLGIIYSDTFRKRYYRAENYFCYKYKVIPLPYEKLKERSASLNNSNFKSETWFCSLLSKVKTNIDCKRNFPILNRYFADFYFSKINLVIEIDGKSHDLSKDYDEKRDLLFSKRKLRVIRIRYGDLKKAEDVIDQIVTEHKSGPRHKISKSSCNKIGKVNKEKLKNLSSKKAKYWYQRNKKVQESMNSMMLAALNKETL